MAPSQSPDRHAVRLQAGLDSLGAVELRSAVSARFCIDAPATLAFDYPTVAALVAFVASRLAPDPLVRSETPRQPDWIFLMQRVHYQ